MKTRTGLIGSIPRPAGLIAAVTATPNGVGLTCFYDKAISDTLRKFWHLCSKISYICAKTNKSRGKAVFLILLKNAIN